jgi:hypothetical protein
MSAGELSQPSLFAIVRWTFGSALQADGSRRHNAAAARSAAGA